MKQLISNASNLLVAIHDDKLLGRRPIPMAEIVLSSAETIYRLVNNQMLSEPVLTDHRFTVDRPGLQALIEDLQRIEGELAKLHDHFDDTQTKLPL